MSGVFQNIGAGGGHTRWVERGVWKVTILEDARHSSVLYICSTVWCTGTMSTSPQRRYRTSTESPARLVSTGPVLFTVFVPEPEPALNPQIQY
jgi:hypothetical protein